MSLPLKIFVIIPGSPPTMAWSSAVPTAMPYRCNYFNARSMDVYITKLRKHLKEDPAIEIINIHGKGYKLIAPENER